MMSVQKRRFKEIADSIRAKTGETSAIKPIDFAAKILSISGDNWDSIQAGGNRRDYSYAFANTTYSILNPSYELICEKCVYMFMNVQGLTDLSNITLNIISSNPNMSYLCMGCIDLVNAPVMAFSYSTATAVRTWVSAFANCVSLKNAEIYFGTGEQNPVSVRNNMANCFFKCRKLKNVTFSGKGSPNNLDLSYAEDLSVESLHSLAESLMDVTEAEAGTYEITINSDQQTKLNAYALNDIITGKGWRLILAEREEINDK